MSAASSLPRIAVLGAGAIGVWTGCSLAATPDSSGSAIPPVLLASPSEKPWFAEGRAQLISLVQAEFPPTVEAGAERWVRQVPAGSVSYMSLGSQREAVLRELSQCKVVFVTVKGQYTPETARLVAEAFPGHMGDLEPDAEQEEKVAEGTYEDLKFPLIISLQNGLQSVRDLKAQLPKLTVLSSVVNFNVVDDGSGDYVKAAGREFVLESPEEGSEYLPLFNHLVGHFQEAGMLVHTVSKEEILRHQYSKLLINLHNGINALSGLPLLRTYEDRAHREVLAACNEEALALLERLKIEPLSTRVNPKWVPAMLRLPNFIFLRLWTRVVKFSPQAKSSTLQDLEAGRKSTEIALLNGEWVRMARELKTDAPVIQGVQRLVEQAAFQAKGSPMMSGLDLCRATGVKLSPFLTPRRVALAGSVLAFGAVAYKVYSTGGFRK